MFNINGRAARWAKGFLILGSQVIGYLVFNNLLERANAEEVSINQHNTAALIPAEKEFNSMLRNTDTECVPGAEFQVNNVTTGEQNNPSVAGLNDGGYVVTWHGDQSGNPDIYGQRYSSSGNEIGAEFQVNNVTTNGQNNPSVAGLSDGGYVVTWKDYQSGNHDIYGQQYSSSGNEIGDEFQVNNVTHRLQSDSSVAGLGDGGYVVTWSGGPLSDYDIYGQQYSASGNEVGDEFQVNNVTTGTHFNPSVVGLGDGGYVVTWEGGNSNIYGQQYSSSGNKVGGEFQVNNVTTSIQSDPSIADLGDGGYVVTWRDYRSLDANIYGQQYSASGNKVGNEFLVNNVTSNNQFDPSVAGLGNGGYVVIWMSKHSSNGDIYGQQYSASGNKVGSEFLVNNVTSNGQHYPSVAGLGDGGYVVTWSSYQSGDADIYGRRYTCTFAESSSQVANSYHSSSMYTSSSSIAVSSQTAMSLASSTGEAPLGLIPIILSLSGGGLLLIVCIAGGLIYFMGSRMYVVKHKRNNENEEDATLSDIENISSVTRDTKATSPVELQAMASVPCMDATGRMSISLAIAYKDLEFGQELGRGRFGIVCQGVWQHREVAIKQLQAKRLSESSLEEFQNETRIMATIRHPGVVQLYGACFEIGRYSLVMEYMPKGSLYEVLHSQQSLPWKLRYRIAMDITSGLSILHAKSILHRDLKSQNILLDSNMNAKLTDFGLSKVRQETRSTSGQGEVIQAAGTVPWMAPELFKRKAKYTQKADIYSYGMILWEIASRENPFADASNPALISQWVMAGEQEEIPKECERQNPRYSALIKWCWNLKSEARPTIEEAARQLKAYPITDEGEENSETEAPQSAEYVSDEEDAPQYQDNLKSVFPGR